jgi:hypothetical protein
MILHAGILAEVILNYQAIVSLVYDNNMTTEYRYLT